MKLPLIRLSSPRPWRRAGWCLAVALLWPAPAELLAQGTSSSLPALGDAASDEIAVAAEGRLAVTGVSSSSRLFSPMWTTAR